MFSPGLTGSAPGPGLVLLRMGLLASGYALMMMVSVLLMPSVPAMAAHFGSVALAQMVLISPIALKIVGAPAAAWLMHRYGRRRPLLCYLLLLAVSGGLSVFFVSFPVQLGLRLCMGFAAAAIATTSTTLVGDYFVGEERNRALSWTGVAPMLGSVLGLFGGGLIAQHWGWQWGNAPLLLALPVWLCALLWLPEPQLPLAPKYAEKLALTERLPDDFVAFLGFAALTAIVSTFGGFQLPLLMAELGIAGASFAGLVLALTSIVGAGAAALYPKLRARLGLAGVFVWIMAICGSVYGLLSVGTDKLWIGIIAPLVGLGGGLLYPFCTGWAVERASPAARPRTVGFVMSAIFIGGVASPFLAEIVRSAFGARVTFAAGAALALAAALLALALKRRVFDRQLFNSTPPAA